MIYTSYWARLKTLQEEGIEPVAISRGKPKGWRGRSLDCLAPTWAMLKMDDEDYDREYACTLASLDAKAVVDFLGSGDVALLCWEKDSSCCHRSVVREWLQFNGFECEEFSPFRRRNVPGGQPSLF